LWVALDDAHPSPLAHQMIADYSYEFIAQGVLGQADADQEVDAAAQEGEPTNDE
jgi:hypothetical protein